MPVMTSTKGMPLIRLHDRKTMKNVSNGMTRIGSQAEKYHLVRNHWSKLVSKNNPVEIPMAKTATMNIKVKK